MPDRVFDFVIIGGGSAGLRARGAVVGEPEEIRPAARSRHGCEGRNAHPGHSGKLSGQSLFQPRLHVVADGAARRRAAQRSVDAHAGPLRAGPHPGGGSSINGLNANRGSPQDYDGWKTDGRGRLELEHGAAVLQEARARSQFLRRVSRKGWADRDHRYPMEDWSGFAQGVSKLLQKRACRSCRIRTASGRTASCRRPCRSRERPARLLRDGLSQSESAIAPEPHHQDRNLRAADIVRRHARRRGGGQGKSGTETVRGREIILACGTIHSPAVLDAKRRRPGRRAREAQYPGGRGGAGRGAQSARTSGRQHLLLPQPQRAALEVRSPSHPDACAIVVECGRSSSPR